MAEGKILYEGWKPEVDGMQVESVDLSTVPLTPKEFFTRYISKRKPVILRNALKKMRTDEWKVEQWTNSYLKEKAGEEMLKVEYRAENSERFGGGKYVIMTFTDLLAKIAEGSEKYYLSTQDAVVDEEEVPFPVTAPLSALLSDIPLNPSLLQGMVPSSYNIWIGNASNGTSSGLHHDYHDNLYVLIRGRKKFNIFSPNNIDFIQTHGKLLKVHKNGLINYIGAPTRADGAPIRAAHADARLEKAEAELARIESELAANPSSEELSRQLKEADLEMDAAIEELLLAETLESVEHMEDDDLDSRRSGPNVFQFASDEEDDQEDMEIGQEGREVKSLSTTTASVPQQEAVPDNFALPGSVVHNQADTLLKFPELAKAKVVCAELGSGDMLYLPASFFHEVVSFVDTSHSEESKGKEANERPGHMALNYWFHPPDCLNDDEWCNPYSSNYWRRKFEKFGLAQ